GGDTWGASSAAVRAIDEKPDDPARALLVPTAAGHRAPWGGLRGFGRVRSIGTRRADAPLWDPGRALAAASAPRGMCALDLVTARMLWDRPGWPLVASRDRLVAV